MARLPSDPFRMSISGGKRRPLLPSGAKAWGTTALVLAAMTAIAAMFYSEMRDSAFAMDDPGLLVYLADTDVSTVEKVFNRNANRFRPVANVAYLLAYGLSGHEFNQWWTLNMALLGLLGTATWVLILRAGAGSALALFGGVLVITSRFVAFQGIQAIGVMEAVGNLLLALLLLFLVTSALHHSPKALVAVAFTNFLLVFTHERYQGLALGLVVFALVRPSVTIRNRMLYSCAFAFPTILLAAVKHFYRVPQLVGTGSAWELGFSLSGARTHSLTALLDVLGVSAGEPYLVGLNVVNQSMGQRAASVGLAALTVSMLSANARDGVLSRVWLSAPYRQLRLGAVAASLMLSLMVPIVITIRLEPRWVLGLYLLTLIGISGHMSRENRRVSQMLVAVTFFVGSLWLNIAFRDALDSIYFRGAQLGVVALLEDAGPAWVGAQEIVIVTGDEDERRADALVQVLFGNTGWMPDKVHVVADLNDVAPALTDLPILEVNPLSGSVRRIPMTPAGILLTGDVFEDGWVGRSLDIRVSNSVCEAVRVVIMPSPWGANRITWSTSQHLEMSDTVRADSYELNFSVPTDGLRARIEFERAQALIDLQEGSERVVSHLLSADCIRRQVRGAGDPGAS